MHGEVNMQLKKISVPGLHISVPGLHISMPGLHISVPGLQRSVDMVNSSYLGRMYVSHPHPPCYGRPLL